MLLAAGEGRRLRPLTEHLPKPLLPVGDTTLIERWLDRFRAAGFHEFVINLWHLGGRIADALGDGSSRGVRIQYAWEPELLETGGGVKNALPLLADDVFVVVSADTICDYPIETLPRELPPGIAGHLVLVTNPTFHPDGDFSLDSVDRIGKEGGQRFTYAGLGVYSRRLFDTFPVGAFKLRAVMDRAIARRELMGELYAGYWMDVGTPERYAQVRRRIGQDTLNRKE